MAGINSNASSGVIKKYIDAQDDKLQTNIDSEASARASADTTLQSNINKEASARLEGDNFLRADLTAETNARETADSALRTDVDTVTAGLSTETSERKTADSVLQGNIDAETTARTTKDGELESSIASETTRAKNAESTLTTNLNAEVTRAKNAEQANATAISNEASARETNDNALSARIDVNTEDIAALKGRSIRYAVHLDSASPTQAQLTSAYQSASGSTAPPEDGTTLVDLNYNKEYTWFESSSTWVDRGSSTINPATNSSYGSVKGQTADGTVKADDGLLSVNGWSTVKNDISANAESISNEVSRATGAETTLQNNIDAEATARTSADTTLQANIDKKVTANTAITGGTFTKVTVDTKGLVTSGASLSASDIPTIAQSQVSGLTSALNGKQAVSNLVTAWQTIPDNTHYPSERLVSDSITSEATARSESDATLQANIDKKVTANANITAGTNCKITYDAKGLVTAGTSLSASDIPTIPESKVSNLVNDLAGKQDKLTAGANITISGNTISAEGTTYDVATASANGLMSSTDKAKLDGIEAGAQKNTVTGVKGSSETAYRTGNVSISKANIGLENVDNTADSSKVVKGASEDGSGNVITDSYVASGEVSGQTVTLLSKSGNTLATFTTQATDTKNTAGSTDTSSKIFLIGATSQAANPQTYSHDTAYVGTDGKLYSGGKVVIASGDTATAASKLATIRAIDGVNFNGEVAITHYGNCSTSPNIAAKVVDVFNFTLVEGAMVLVRFGANNTAANPTLNVNKTGGKPMYYGTKRITKEIVAGTTYMFVYSGIGYDLIGSIDTTNTAGSTSTTSKLYLIGAKTQTYSAQTYSRSTAYIGTDGKLYSDGTVVITAGDVDSALSSTSTKPVQNKVVNNALNAKQDKVTISTSDPSGGKDGDIWFKYGA